MWLRNPWLAPVTRFTAFTTISCCQPQATGYAALSVIRQYIEQQNRPLSRPPRYTPQRGLSPAGRGTARSWVDHAIGLMEDLTHRGLVPLRDHPTLLGEVSEEADSSNQRIQPLHGGSWTVECDVVDRSLSPPSRGRGPDDFQRLSLSRSWVTTSS
jgi:hypothetical protein